MGEKGETGEKDDQSGKQGVSPVDLEQNPLNSTIINEEEMSMISLPDEKIIKPIASVTWEDITAYARVILPEDFEKYRLVKKTIGLVWSETDEYIVLVQDYDLSNRGKKYKHNDFHIIPKGVIKEIRYLGTELV